MKKTMKAILLVTMSVLMCLCSLPIYAAAEEQNQVMPRLSHMDGASFAFSAESSGGYIEATYVGYSASFVQAKLTVKVEKRFLLVFWNDVDTWTATSTELYGFFGHVMSLNGSGKYRATFTLEVTGTNGTVDVVDSQIQSEY